MKYYAVRKGRKPGIYRSWAECQDQVSGYPNAEFKSFKDKAEAEAFLGKASSSQPRRAEMEAYVDGSYQPKTKTYGYGGVILYQGQELTYKGGGKKAELLKMRNVSGEMIAAMKAVVYALDQGVNHLALYYDYAGIEKWATGDWQAKNAYTQAYRDFMQEKGKQVQIHFHKVAAHTGNRYNEWADQLAKAGSQKVQEDWKEP